MRGLLIVIYIFLYYSSCLACTRCLFSPDLCAVFFGNCQKLLTCAAASIFIVYDSAANDDCIAALCRYIYKPICSWRCFRFRWSKTIISAGWQKDKIKKEQTISNYWPDLFSVLVAAAAQYDFRSQTVCLFLNRIQESIRGGNVCTYA